MFLSSDPDCVAVVVVAGGEAIKAERVMGEAVVSIQGQWRGSHFLLSRTSALESSMAKLHLVKLGVQVQRAGFHPNIL